MLIGLGGLGGSSLSFPPSLPSVVDSETEANQSKRANEGLNHPKYKGPLLDPKLSISPRVIGGVMIGGLWGLFSFLQRRSSQRHFGQAVLLLALTSSRWTDGGCCACDDRPMRAINPPAAPYAYHLRLDIGRRALP